MSYSVNRTRGLRRGSNGNCNSGGLFDDGKTFGIANNIIQTDHFSLAFPWT